MSMDTNGQAVITREFARLDGGELPLTVARANGTGAAVVILPSAFGVGPDLEAQMRELATTARLVAALDPFFRSDPGPSPFEDQARMMKRIQGLDRARISADFRAAITWARAQPEVRSVIVVGICLGGPFSLLAAAEGWIDGVVTWHGSRMENYLERAAHMTCPMRFHFGAVDPVVPPAAVAAVRAAFANRSDVEISVHEGATHGFSHRAAPQAYNANAERAGMDAVHALSASR